MSSLGIYFGPKVISIVETAGKKIVHSTQIPQTTISESELEEKVPAEVKAIEIIALFKDELRRNKIEAKEATLCLSGKDLIIRTFELPMLPREELQSAINFEVKKYIPFKVEELISDSQVQFEKQSRTNLVLFMGLKKETLDRYISILSQLDIKAAGIEYSAFSVLRCLKISGANARGVIAILEVDLQGEDEVNFTVLENGFPLFSRDIAVLGGAEGLAEAVETQPAETLEKLKTEVRVSLDYYQRKFPTKRIKTLFLVSGQDQRSELGALMSEIGLPISFVDVARHIGRSVPYSLSYVKGYSASLSKAIKTNLRVDLLSAKEKLKTLKEEPQQLDVASLFQGLKLDARMILFGLLICVAPYGLGLYRMVPLRKELNNILTNQAQVAIVSPMATYEELTAKDAEYKRKLDTLDKLVKKQLYLTRPLDIIPRVIPRGMWLTSFSFKKSQDKAELSIEGAVYLNDSNKEFETVNKFLTNLKENADFSGYFKDTNINSVGHAQLDKITVTNFSISSRAY